MDALQKLHEFWSSFGLKAYDENTVPNDAMKLNDGKYLTYSVARTFLDEPTLVSASLWYKSTSWAAITAKAQQIGESLGYGGTLVPYTGGALWVKRGVPFAQRMGDEDDTIRRIYINCEVEYFS